MLFIIIAKVGLFVLMTNKNLSQFFVRGVIFKVFN